MQVRQEGVPRDNGARLHPCTLAVGFIPLIHLELNGWREHLRDVRLPSK